MFSCSLFLFNLAQRMNMVGQWTRLMGAVRRNHNSALQTLRQREKGEVFVFYSVNWKNNERLKLLLDVASTIDVNSVTSWLECSV